MQTFIVRLIVAGACVLAAAAAPLAARSSAAGTPSRSSTVTTTFGTGTAGWSGLNAAVTTTRSPVRSAPRALAATLKGTSAANLTVISAPVPVAANRRWTGRAWVRGHAHARRVSAALLFKDAAGVPSATVWAQSAVDSATGWVATPGAVGLAPRGAATVQLLIIVWKAARGETVFVDDATLTSSPASSAAIRGPLHVRGTGLVDRDGHPVVLRGIQRFGLEGGTRTPAPTDAEIGQLKAWGANVVRISLGEQFWMSTACAYDKGYARKVDAVVRSVTSRGMVALVNLHYSVTSPCGRPGLQPMADAAFSVPFWKQVAARYARNPLVAFDLYNEPHDVSDAVWLGGGPVPWEGKVYQAAGMQQLYDAVRSTGAKNVVVVSGLDWATRPPIAPLVAGSDIVYAAHAYTCPKAAPPACPSPTPYDPSSVLDAWLPLSSVVPVMVTEFGWPDRNDGTYNANVIAYADTHHWSGWDAFAFDGSTTGLFDLVQSVAADRVTYEPTPSGMAVMNGLGANAR